MTDSPPQLPPEMIEAGAEVLRESWSEGGDRHMWRGNWHQTNDAARDVYLAMFGVLVEAGYRLVPMKPTAKMVAAGRNVRVPTPQTVWSAMLTADEED